MATRTIRTGIGTYQRADGVWTHGVLGDEVTVHEDDVARFDRLNLPELQLVEAALAEAAAAALLVEEAEAERLANEQQAQADADAKAEQERFDAAVKAAVEKRLADERVDVPADPQQQIKFADEKTPAASTAAGKRTK